ncbi:MAG: hypothetical protein QOE65_461 [Solirubrobacteraceae bacterium]|jgi:hypothetical protein|nr:hypothetical protein [Solirubrobacteraceae bacterium]
MGFSGRVILAVVAAAALVESAAAAPREELELRFSTQAPAAVAPFRVGVLYRGPGQPEGKPSPIRSAVIEAPPGTSFGGGAAIAACQATDEEIQARGRDACPAGSRVAGGFLTAITGFGPPIDPFRTDAWVYKTPDGFVELVQQAGTNTTLGFDRAHVAGATITLHPPATPGGPPDGQTAVREARFDFPATGFVVSPPRCPADGLWRSRARYAFADGRAVVVTDASPCRPDAPAPRPLAPVRLRMAVSPRSVPPGRALRYRFHVRASRAACAAHAAVRFAGRRLRTDSRGRASAVARLTRRGPRRVTATKRGCGTARATIVVRRR